MPDMVGISIDSPRSSRVSWMTDLDPNRTKLEDEDSVAHDLWKKYMEDNDISYHYTVDIFIIFTDWLFDYCFGDVVGW